MALASFACSGHGYGEPILVDRIILSDAVFGTGTDIPQEASCVAESKLDFDGNITPFSIAVVGEDDESSTTKVVVNSDLHIRIDEHSWHTRGGSCPSGNLYYVIPASDDDPINLVENHPRCMLEQTATKEGTVIPTTLTIRGHLEAYDVAQRSVVLVIDHCGIAGDI